MENSKQPFDKLTMTGQALALAERALAIAVGYLGKGEEPKGSNSGPFVMGCLNLVGISSPAPWCMAFVYRVYAQAAAELATDNPVVKTAGVHDCWNRTAQSKKLMKVEVVQRPELITAGSQFVLFTSDKAGHTGLVERVEKKADGWVMHTIEGNSNDDGSRDGYEVVRHERKLVATNKAFVGIIKY